MLPELASTTVRLATPYLYAALGETVVQRSGVLNLGVEGMMAMGAFVAWAVAYKTGSLTAAIAAAAATGAIMGLLMAIAVVTCRAEQGITGIAVTMLGLGLSSVLFKSMATSPHPISGFPPIADTWPAPVYAAFLLVPVVAALINRTRFGLKVRAVGQDPRSADANGVNVAMTRYACLAIGGAFAGVGGASLSVALLNIFQDNMTNGIGFIAVALVYFGGWSPIGVLGGALLFSFVNALQLWLQIRNPGIPSDVLVMAPYVLTVVALALPFRKARQPAALGRPYAREGATA